jgi:hypothetical protein
MLIKLQNEYQLRERGRDRDKEDIKRDSVSQEAGGRHSMLTWAASTPNAPKPRWDEKMRL